MNLNSRQKLILEKLLHKYESSKTYKGENAVRQSFSISPSDVYPNYDNDFEDPNSIEDFEKELNVLKTENLIEIEIKDRRVIKIKAESKEKAMRIATTNVTLHTEKVRENTTNLLTTFVSFG